MTVQQQYRSGKERRTFDMSSTLLPAGKEQRWNKDRRFMGDGDELYDPDWEVLEQELEPYTHISRAE